MSTEENPAIMKQSSNTPAHTSMLSTSTSEIGNNRPIATSW